MNLQQSWETFWINALLFLSAEEQDHQAWGEEAAEGGSKEVNSFPKINLLFSCSSVSSLFLVRLAKHAMARLEIFPFLVSFIMSSLPGLVNPNCYFVWKNIWEGCWRINSWTEHMTFLLEDFFHLTRKWYFWHTQYAREMMLTAAWLHLCFLDLVL